MISYKDALNKYVAKWGDNNKNDVFEQLIPIYPKRTSHLLLIGSPYRSETTNSTLHNKETEEDEFASTEDGELEYDNTRSNTLISDMFD